MPIIDAQVHLWRKGKPSPQHQPEPYLVEHAIRDMDAAGVDGAILHPPTSWDPDSNEQAVEAVQAYPRRFAILGYPPVDRPESPALIATWKERPGMVGARLYFNQPHNRSWPTDGTLDWLWPAAEQAPLPLAPRHAAKDSKQYIDTLLCFHAPDRCENNIVRRRPWHRR